LIWIEAISIEDGNYETVRWLRYELFRGALSPAAFERSERPLADFTIPGMGKQSMA
jgi:hypothetical protein